MVTQSTLELDWPTATIHCPNCHQPFPHDSDCAQHEILCPVCKTVFSAPRLEPPNPHPAHVYKPAFSSRSPSRIESPSFLQSVAFAVAATVLGTFVVTNILKAL